MAVFEHAFRRYEGPWSSERSRLLVVARYALTEAFQRRLHVVLLLLAQVPVLIGLVFIYLRHNNELLRMLAQMNPEADRLLAIGDGFLLRYLALQCGWAYVLVIFLAPGLVAPDLKENGLALYLARPLERWEYLSGKLVALLVPLSVVSWLPLGLLFGFAAALEGAAWRAEHLRAGVGVIVGSVGWIVVISLVALAVSVLLRWRVAASGALFLGYFVAAGVGHSTAFQLRSHWPEVLDLGWSAWQVWQALFGQVRETDLPIAAPLGMFALLAVGSLLVLRWRIRAYEVVR